MAQKSSVADFYTKALAHNYTLDDYERDDEGVWRLKFMNSKNQICLKDMHNVATPRSNEHHTTPNETLRAENIDDPSREDDTSSVSSTTAEIGGDTRWVSEGMKSGRTIVDSFLSSRSSTPVVAMPVDCAGAAIASIGEGLVANDPKMRPSRLVETYESYQARFVDFRKDQACKRMEAALSNAWPSASDDDPFQLAVFTHDDLSRSNGLGRINEERSAVCVAIKDLPAQHDTDHTHVCEVCILPPDIYELRERMLNTSAGHATTHAVRYGSRRMRMTKRRKVLLSCGVIMTLLALSLLTYAGVALY